MSEPRMARDLPDRTLSIEAKVSEDKLHLREELATAKLEDGREVEVAANLGSADILVTVRKPGEGWRTYALTPQALVTAVLNAEAAEPAPAARAGVLEAESAP